MCRTAKYVGGGRGAVLQGFDKMHGNPSMTQDLCMQRNLYSSRAAEELQCLVWGYSGMTVNMLGKR